MRIGELAAATGASVRSLRYYEERGLLVSTRSASGQRHYAEPDVERVLFLRRLYSAGLSSSTIFSLLPCAVAPSAANADAALEVMVAERARLDEHIDELVRTRETIDGFIAANRVHRDRLASGV